MLGSKQHDSAPWELGRSDIRVVSSINSDITALHALSIRSAFEPRLRKCLSLFHYQSQISVAGRWVFKGNWDIHVAIIKRYHDMNIKVDKNRFIFSIDPSRTIQRCL